MKELKYNYCDRLFLLGLAVISIILNLIYGYGSSSEIFGGVLLGLVDVLTFSAYLLISRTPCLAELVLLISQIITFGYDMIAGATLNEATEDVGLAILITFVAFVVALKFSKTNGEEKNNIEKVNSKLLYDRKIHNIKWYYKIIIYSIIIIAVMATANSEVMNTYMNGTAWRVFAALTVIFPLIRMLSLISTTTLAYEVFGLYIFTEIFTVYMQYKTGNGNIVETLFIIEQAIVLFYTAYRCKVLNTEKDTKNKEAKK